jgi:Holliday junction resolvase-like predicted endonuclease
MPDETHLNLLKLTGQGKAVNLEEFLTQVRQRQLALATINHLHQTGLVSIANGFLNMDVSQRMMLAGRLIHEGRDPAKVSRALEWQEFEKFANDTLVENGFQTLKHFVFKASSGRREIDVLAWNDNFILAIDCKHWHRGISPHRLVLVAQAQTERVRALAKRPELLARAKIGDLARRSIMPIILTLCEAPKRSLDGVPIVSVAKLMNFLYGVSPIDDSILQFHIESADAQSLLL